MPNQYVMSATLVGGNGGTVTWTANGAPDYTGAQSGYSLGTIVNIQLISTITGSAESGNTVGGITELTSDVQAFGPGAVAATVVGLQGVPISANAPATGMALSYNVDGSGKWAPQYGYGPVVNVKDFGATGNGITDDTVAIQAAINFGTQTSIVFFPAGQYLVTAPTNGIALTVLNHQVSLQGAGVGASSETQASVIIVNGLGSGILIETAAGDETTNCQIRNLAFFNGVTVPLDFIIVHSSYTVIEDVYLQGNLRFGVLIESGNVGTNVFGYSTLYKRYLRSIRFLQPKTSILFYSPQ